MLPTDTNHTFHSFLWGIFLVFVIFASSLPGITIPGIGLLYPFRICLPFMLLYVVLNKGKYGRRNSSIENSLYFFLCMLIYGFITFLWVRNLENAIKLLVNYIYGFSLVIVMARLISTRDEATMLLWIVTVILFVLMGMGLYEGLTGKYLFSSEFADALPYRGNNRIHYPVACFGNPNDFVFVLFGFMPFVNAIASNLFTKNKLFEFVIRFCYFLSYCVISYFASCRMGLLLIAFAILVEMFFIRNRTFKRILITLSFIVLLTVLCFKHTLIFNAIRSEDRIVIWKDVLLNLRYYFYLGTGPGNSYLPIPGVQYINSKLINPHSWFIEVLVEFGIIIFIMLLMWYALIFIRGAKRVKLCQNMEDWRIKSAALKFLLYFIPMSVMSSSVSALPSFWLMVSTVLIFIEVPMQEVQQNQSIEIKYAQPSSAQI